VSIREVSYGGGVNKRDVLREVSLGEVSSARHLDVIKAHQTQSEAIRRIVRRAQPQLARTEKPRASSIFASDARSSCRVSSRSFNRWASDDRDRVLACCAGNQGQSRAIK
jgi:hypothetical protein